jgi:transcriptional regulator with XRE-family HTH domain
MRVLRRRALLTQHGLAARSGVSQGTIARIESGKRTELRVGTIRALSEALGVEPSEVDEFRPSLGLPPAEG